MMFAAPPSIETTVFARIPGGRLLEGPSFDRQGQLWITDIPTGRIFRIAPDGTPTKIASSIGRSSGSGGRSCPTSRSTQTESL